MLLSEARCRGVTCLSVLLMACLGGCKRAAPDAALEAPPDTPAIVASGESGTVHVERPERFQLTQAVTRQVVSKLNVTGVVSPDISRELPVLSLANGRVMALHVGLGDTVRKGQLVMEVQSPDVSAAFGSYLKSVSDEHLTEVTLTRDKLLYDKGAIAQSQLDIAQNGEDDARAARAASEQQLKIFGVDKNRPGDTVKVYAPAAGVVISQNVTASGAAGITFAGSTGSLIIADLSHVWVICDVYESDLNTVQLGQHADIRLNAFPGQVFSGTISDIGATLDPSIRTAKIRIQVENAKRQLRIGMFATATLNGLKADATTAVLAAAVLRLHDHAFVFVPTAIPGTFQRVPVQTGLLLDGSIVQVQGLSVDQSVVANALELQNTADQQ